MVPTRSPKRNRPAVRRQQGIAAVELAILLAAVSRIHLRIIEMCSAIYLRQTLTIAAYEGARVACHPQGATVDTQAAAQRILVERAINGGSITTKPSQS